MVWDLNQAAWDSRFALAEDFYRRHGHLAIPLSHTTADGDRLGAWITTQRTLRKQNKLAPERVTRLEAIGMIWQPREAQWLQGLNALADFHRRHNHLRIPEDYRTPAGHRLRSWLHVQRTTPGAGQ